MATVIYKNSGWGAELNALLQGAGMLKDVILSNKYKNEMAKLLGGYEKESQDKVIPGEDMMADVNIQAPTGWGYEDEGFKIDSQGKQTLLGGFKPTGFETQQTTVPTGQRTPDQIIPKTPEQIAALKEAYRRKMEMIGTGYPRQMRGDPMMAFPQDKQGKDLGQLEAEQKIRAKYRAGKSAQMFKDLKGNYYDANTQQGFAGIRKAGKKGWNPKRVPSDQQQQALEKMYNKDRFMGEEDYVKFLEDERVKGVTTPEERRQMKEAPVLKYLDRIASGKSAGQKQIIEKYKAKVKKTKVDDLPAIVYDAYKEMMLHGKKKPAKKDVLGNYGL